MEDRYDVVVVGAGPAGLAAGARAAERGLSHVVLERGRLAETIVRYQKGKHVMAEPPALPLRSELVLPFEAGTREAVLEAWERSTAKAKTKLLFGPQFEVVAADGKKGGFRLRLKGGRVISCGSLVLAVGLQGNLRTFGVPGDDLPHVTYQLDDPDEHSDKRILVVGAGDSAIENALALADANEVGLVNRGDEFPRAKPRNRSLVEAAIKDGRIIHHAKARVRKIEPGRVLLEAADAELALDCDLLIGRLGAIPPRKFLESLGVEFTSADANAIPRVSESYETTAPGVYAVGALAGAPLIKQCLNQGCEVIEHILGHPVEPADEPLLAAKFEKLGSAVADVLARVRATIPIFSTLGRVQLREVLADPDAHVHCVPAGTVVCKRNDFTETFFAILEGGVDVAVPRDERDLDTNRPAGEVPEIHFELGAGQFFGEMNLISGRRRVATVTTTVPSVLIEISRSSMLELVQEHPAIARAIDEAFILRRLQSDLAPGVAASELEPLAAAAVVERYTRGQTLFAEGDESDGLHLIRRGAVTVSRRKAGGEQILAYLPAGNVVGEMALFEPDRRRQATVRAAILTETIRLPTEAVTAFLARHDEVRRRLRDLEGQRLIENAMRIPDRAATGLVDFLVSAGVGEATDVLLIDEALCIRCDNCERACAETHGGVSRLDREAGPTYATVHVPTSCRHCENPSCMTDCPPDALRRHPNGEVYILDNCIGCGNCATNCPYGVIQIASIDTAPPRGGLLSFLFGTRARTPAPDSPKLAVKCDLCQNIPSRAGGSRAACVASCPTGAIMRVDPKRFVDRSTRSRED